ncbi:Slp family lipoprotein [Dokdonella sp.]|uniref:Slp family lipoprotein n=1 Tax=Dokdonella sp. TaxID=2291710 RepID=UPI0031CAD7E6|nr:Slp family lipoprotein [Dokdonella sp.]
MNKCFLIALAGLALAACASVPTPLRGDFSAGMPRDVVGGATPLNVRWGGEIIKVEPKADSTCFEILARTLDSSARPILKDPAGGRFIACREGFYDPEVFTRGRLVTVVGTVTGTDHGKVGEFDYSYPHVAAEAIYLWPPRLPGNSPPAWDPWFYGYGPYWGPYWGRPYWGPYWGGAVIIHRGPSPQPPRH